MNKIKKIGKRITCGILTLAIALCGNCASVFADGSFSVSPMNQKIILTPGETYYGSFRVTNPADNENNFAYKVTLHPFYVNDNYETEYENNGDYNQMVDWVKINETEGIITPNSTKEIGFSVTVPQNAPAGGQYAAIKTSSNTDEGASEGINIKANYSIAHIIYAEVAGTTERKGEVLDANVPGFIFDGNISGTSSIKNTGNVHGTATYKLQVFPLFSNEEVYTNEENPEEKTILPDRTRTNNSYWDETPAMGIFNVKYTVEFEGVTTEVTKMVIKCPLWLLFVILFVIVAIIIWLVMKSKSRKKAGRK